jgi:hypothetical protein
MALPANGHVVYYSERSSNAAHSLYVDFTPLELVGLSLLNYKRKRRCLLSHRISGV